MNSQEISKIYKTHSPVPPSTCWTGSLPGFSRSPKHGSSVEISAIDSLISKTWIVWKFQKFIRQNHQYLLNRKLTWIFEVTQTSWLSRNVSNGSLDLENIKFWANRLNSFWVSKENVAIWQKYRFSHPMEQMDLSCPQTVQSEICQKCRETIPLVQVCFRFELSLTVLKLLSKIWVNPWNFEEILAVFCVFSPQDSVRIILKLSDYSNYTRIHKSRKFGENRSSSFWEQTVNKKKTIKKINRSKT